MEATRLAIALDQREDGVLAAGRAFAGALLTIIAMLRVIAQTQAEGQLRFDFDR
jgi:hypothetical protein